MFDYSTALKADSFVIVPDLGDMLAFLHYLIDTHSIAADDFIFGAQEICKDEMVDHIISVYQLKFLSALCNDQLYLHQIVRIL